MSDATQSESTRDSWAEWLLNARFGGDPGRRAAMLEFLTPIRDRILDDAALAEGKTLLDIGSGDGLIAFGALDRVGPTGSVIMQDISTDLLEHSRAFAESAGLAARCRFVHGSADDLADIADGTVDAVTTRSVLIYLPAAAKARALAEFHRVLRPGGRISLFEPINSFGMPEPDNYFAGYDVTPVAELASRIRATQHQDRAAEEHPLLDFDERDLLAWTRAAGFAEIHLEYSVDLSRGGWHDDDWNTFMWTPGNPLDPPLGEIVAEALTPAEAERFIEHLRPLVEGRKGTQRFARCHLWAQS